MMKSFELYEYLNFESVVMENKNLVLKVVFDFKACPRRISAIQNRCKTCQNFHFKSLVRKKLKIKSCEVGLY